MNISEKYYTMSLYPFQDGVASIVKKLNTPFYLTGGTALSRHYFNHRYSEDLDLFVNNDLNYSNWVKKIIVSLEKNQKAFSYSLCYDQLRKEEFHAQIYLSKQTKDNEIYLKIDLINDISKRYGDYEHNDILGLIDSWCNILSNKLTAIFRYEAKDIVDIWAIAKNKSFNWKKIIKQAKTKEAGIDPITLHAILTSFPLNELDSIKWIATINKNKFKEELDIIADDILNGDINSLTP